MALKPAIRLATIFLVASHRGSITAAYQFTSCRDDVLAILNGTKSLGHITSENIREGGWIWDGRIARLRDDFSRSEVLAITYKGCVEICGNHTEYNQPSDALGIVTTWVFPLSIVFNLPFDSMHTRKYRIFFAVCAWLGSAPAAMTATLFNIAQIRMSHKASVQIDNQAMKDACYTLSCLNQFELRNSREFMEILCYGLFRPLGHARVADISTIREIEHSRQLLAAIAFQLRMLRRRAVIPTILSLGTFLAAFVFSVVLAFADVGEHINVTPLTLGLLWSWLPVLLVFTVLDRNPVSADRSAELLTRWLYNVEVVRAWKSRGAQNTGPDEAAWWTPHSDTSHLSIGEFTGQGRNMTYDALVHSALRSYENRQQILDRVDANVSSYDALANVIMERMDGPRPNIWWGCAIFGFLLFWMPIMMAFVEAFTSPTVGIGCWSGSFLIFGALSSVTWLVQLFSRDCSRGVSRGICRFVDVVSFGFLVMITMLVLVGSMNNCYCNTTWFAQRFSGGYMTFDSFEFVRRNYDVVTPWAASASAGGGLALVVLVAGVWEWKSWSPLWRTHERQVAHRQTNMGVYVASNMNWLQ